MKVFAAEAVYALVQVGLWSPQSRTTLKVSSTPGSVNEPETVTLSLTMSVAGEAVIVTVGATLRTTRFAVWTIETRPSPSSSVKVTT